MEKVFFDTSVLVPLVTEQLQHHTSSHARFVSERKRGSQLCCSTHVIAECYATLTALPVPKRISGEVAQRLLHENLLKQMKLIDLGAEDYADAMQLCADRNRISGQIYDALHLVAALKAGCETVYTYNTKHVNPLAVDKLQIRVP